MSRKATLAFTPAIGLAVILYATRFVPTLALPRDVSDFFGGVAIGLAIGAVFTWLAGRA